jgi:hypothetical protein
MQHLHPITTVELFHQERSALLQLLNTLPDEQWANSTPTYVLVFRSIYSKRKPRLPVIGKRDSLE